MNEKSPNVEPSEPGNPEVLRQIRQLYAIHGVTFRQIEHEATRTSADSARVRGESERIGGKALLLKVSKQTFCLFVLPANLKLDSSKLKRHFSAKRIRFATPDELRDQTGLVPGSVPPFGNPILPFDLMVDERFRENKRIAFNAGMLTVSHILDFDDYQRIAKPQFLDFAANGSN